MWCKIWLFLFTLSISPPVQLVVSLSWANNNFKSSKPNKSISPFRYFCFYDHLCTWFPHMTSHVTILQFSQTCKVKLINHFFEILLKIQLFEASNHYSIIMWYITWLFLFMLSIFFPIQPVVSMSWADYMISHQFFGLQY